MRRRTLITILVCCLAAVSSFSKDKKRDWQTGKLVSIEVGDSTTLYSVTTTQSTGTAVPLTYKTWVYVVETDTMVYQFAAYTGFWGEDHPYPFTIGRDVRFALDPNKPDRAYLIDEKGKEFKASLVKKAVKQPAK